VKQLVTVDIRKKYVRPAIVVKIAHSDTHSVVGVSGIGQASLLGDIRERSIFVLPIKTIPISGLMTIKTRPRRHGIPYASGIYEKNVH